MQPPRLRPETAVNSIETAFDRLEEAGGSTEEPLLFRQVMRPGARLSGTSWAQCIFEGCRFQEASAGRSQFTDVVFCNCDLSNADFADSVFCRVEFTGCKLAGARLYGCGWNDVRLRDCQGGMSSFTGGQGNGLVFEDCRLEGARLDALSGRYYAFNRCGLQGAGFAGTVLAGVDLSDSDITGAVLGEKEMRGLRVSAQQAVELAKLLGVVVV